MYPEFVAIYVCLGILVILVVVIMVLIIMLLHKLNNIGSGKNSYYANQVGNVKNQMGVVFCKKCTTQFDATERFCPRCGTPR